MALHHRRSRYACSNVAYIHNLGCVTEESNTYSLGSRVVTHGVGMVARVEVFIDGKLVMFARTGA